MYRRCDATKFSHLLQVSTQMTQGTCAHIGGYFVSNFSYSTTSPAPATYWSTTTASSLSPMNLCFYYNFNCPGYTYRRQCYSRRSSAVSCPTCNHIGGVFAANYGCYYYSSDCRYLSAGKQCHTNRCCKLFCNCCQ